MNIIEFIAENPDCTIVIDDEIRDHGASWKTHRELNSAILVDGLDMYGQPTGKTVIKLYYEDPILAKKQEEKAAFVAEYIAKANALKGK